MFGMKTLKTIAAVGALALMASGAQAVTVNFDTHHSGLDVGQTTLGTLSAVQVGNDVEFVYTNTAIGFDPGHTTQLYLTYLGQLATVTLTNIAGVSTNGLSISPPTNAGLQFQFEISWPTSNKDDGALRLNPGESSTFSLLNTTLAGFFQGDNFGMIHIQGLTDGESAKYVASAPGTAVVPVPAAGLLLIGALGGLAALRRRRKA